VSDNRYDARRLAPKAKEALRLRAVQAVVAHSMAQVEAVRSFGVSRTALHHWVKAYRRNGGRALKAKRLGRPKRARLAGHQAAMVVRLITTRCPDQLLLPFALRFGLQVSV
jgi:transposase